MRRIAFVTGTRADWGLLSPIAKALNIRPDAEVCIIATNMHLLRRYGHTVDEIEADGLTVSARVEMYANADTATDNEGTRVCAMARCLDGMADALERLRPDMVVILGDRYEMLAAASAAVMMHVPIVHIAGGEISEGAVDDSIRHAITKMSALHLTETELYRQRVIRMGEHPDRVVNTGAIGVYNALNTTELMPLAELRRSLGFPVDTSTFIVTYHPATMDSEATPAEHFGELLAALDRFPDHKVIITYPNNDAHGAPIISLIEQYAAANPGRVLARPSLGARRYLSALHHVAAVVGNSSSGIIEVPSAGIPTVDIGMRQRGRISAPSVIHCAEGREAIAEAVTKALSPNFRALAAKAENPYFKPNTLQLMVEAIMSADLDRLRAKTFYDA